MSEKLIKPDVFDCREKVMLVGPGYKYDFIERNLKQSKKVCFTKTYGTVLTFYSWLKKRIKSKYTENSYQAGRKFREELREISSNMLVKVLEGRIDLKGSPSNPWLKDFYQGIDCYYISFPDLLGINGAWQWFSKGIKFPGLSCKLHPFYGTYFPTRFEHLELFDDWLKNTGLQIKKAVDIGTGCGVLVFYMLKYGIINIHATDINPNAIYSLKEDLQYHNYTEQVKLFEGKFFAGAKDKYDLVVFNPPWIPGKPKTVIDKGIFYEKSFWKEFFDEASSHMEAGGRLVILFSDLALVEGINHMHPVKEQLRSDERFRVLNVLTKHKKTSKNDEERKAFRQTNGEKDETIELWDIQFD